MTPEQVELQISSAEVLNERQSRVSEREKEPALRPSCFNEPQPGEGFCQVPQRVKT